MILKVGYLLQGTIQRIREIISAITTLFADSSNYKADSEVIYADNDSNI